MTAMAAVQYPAALNRMVGFIIVFCLFINECF